MTNGNGEASEAADRARLRDDALSLLREALDWFLTPAEWVDVAAILHGLDLEAGGLDLAEPARRQALEDAVVQLELA